MSDLVQVFFVISIRNHRAGTIAYQVSDNLEEIPRGSRPVFGTGHTNRDIVMSRMKKCKDGVWFKEQHKTRAVRQHEDNLCRKRLHQTFLRGQRKPHRRERLTAN